MAIAVQCGTVPSPSIINRSESCIAIAGNAVSCFGGTWVTVPLDNEVENIDWIEIPPPGG